MYLALSCWVLVWYLCAPPPPPQLLRGQGHLSILPCVSHTRLLPGASGLNQHLLMAGEPIYMILSLEKGLAKQCHSDIL